MAVVWVGVAALLASVAAYGDPLPEDYDNQQNCLLTHFGPTKVRVLFLLISCAIRYLYFLFSPILCSSARSLMIVHAALPHKMMKI